MSKTCIICGQVAGSGEHVFPAALGGRRVNKNIYCTTHDNGYSSLVGELANQLDVFNAHLGVINDHSKEVKSVLTKDAHTGQPLKLSAKESKFTKPRVISQQKSGNGVLMNMAFPDRQSINSWIDEQKAKGLDVVIQEKGKEMPYLLDTVHHQRHFGGSCGLGSVAYVTQTFLAQSFPELARSPDVAAFIAYTQAIAKVAHSGGCKNSVDGQSNEKLTEARKELERALSSWDGEAPIWWDFDPQPNTTPNVFAFGHRVTVGVDASDGQIFGRFSLFSSLHFAMCFGTASAAITSKAVTIDIDPLAEHPPNDINRHESTSVIPRVTRPASPTADLAAAIVDEAQEVVFSELIKRMEDHALAKLAREIYARFSAGTDMTSMDGQNLICRVVDEQSQRVWNLTKELLINNCNK